MEVGGSWEGEKGEREREGTRKRSDSREMREIEARSMSGSEKRARK